MDAEISAQIGATLHERSPERTAHRYCTRTWDTRVGSIELRSRFSNPSIRNSPDKRTKRLRRDGRPAEIVIDSFACRSCSFVYRLDS